MGTSRSVAELSGKFARFGVTLSDSRAALGEVGDAGKDIFHDALRKKGVDGTTKVSRAVKVRYDLRPGRVTVRYTGPAHLLDRPTSRRVITPRGMRGSRRSRQARAANAGTVAAFGGNLAGAFGSFTNKSGARALVINGQPRAYAFHPGTKGLGFFKLAKAEAVDELPEVYRDMGLRTALREVFR